MQRVGATLLQCLTGSDEDVKHQMGPYFTWKVKNVKECFLKNIVGYDIQLIQVPTTSIQQFLGSSAKTRQLEC